MIDVKKINEFDIVVLATDLPKYGLKKGERGVIIEVFENPETYDVEFVNELTGESKLAYEVKPEMFNIVENEEEDISSSRINRNYEVIDLVEHWSDKPIPKGNWLIFQRTMKENNRTDRKIFNEQTYTS